MLAVHLDPMQAMGEVVDRLQSRWVPEIEESEEYFDWEPLSEWEFFAGLGVVHKHVVETQHCWPEMRFMDVGCGIGTKLLLARWSGYAEIVGLERRPEFADVARVLAPEAKVVVADAFDYTYGGFDVVYSFRLCRDLERQHELTRHIVASMSKGAYLFLAGSTVEDANIRSRRVEHIDDQVWRVT